MERKNKILLHIMKIKKNITVRNGVYTLDTENFETMIVRVDGKSYYSEHLETNVYTGINIKEKSENTSIIGYVKFNEYDVIKDFGMISIDSFKQKYPEYLI